MAKLFSFQVCILNDKIFIEDDIHNNFSLWIIMIETFVYCKLEDRMGLGGHVELGLDEVQRNDVVGRLHGEHVAQLPLEGRLQPLEDLDPVEEPLVLRDLVNVFAVAGVAHGRPRAV